jgi:type I restriction enzyme R subunit
LFSERDFQDCKCIYIDIYQDFRKGKESDKENINNDIVFEIELIGRLPYKLQKYLLPLYK